MGDIDDLYKQEAEDIDLKFLEELQVSKDRAKSLQEYQKNLIKSREKFSRDYEKFNAAEISRIRKMKKKIEGMPDFKHLEISHFDFEFGFWERLWMRVDVLWFRFMRKIRRFGAWIFPSWLIYGWCKVRDFFRSTWRDFAALVESIRKWFVNLVVKVGLWVWEVLKGVWVLVMGSKALFWKKAVTEKAADGKPEEKKDEEKKG